MRIIGGKWKGHSLSTPKPAGQRVQQTRPAIQKVRQVRPSASRTREALFSILTASPQIEFANARVRDLFAGVGTLGFEALSRGAAYCVFVEQEASVCKILHRNRALLQAQNKSAVLCRDARRLGTCKDLPCQLIFADPPYGKGLAEKALASALRGGWFGAGAHIIVEEDKRASFTPPAGLTLYDRRQYGDTALIFLTYDAL